MTDSARYLAEIDRLKADYDAAVTKLCTVTEERNMLRARLDDAEARLEQGRTSVVRALVAAIRAT